MSDPANVFRAVQISKETRDALEMLSRSLTALGAVGPNAARLNEIVRHWDNSRVTEVDVTTATLPSPGWSVKA